jgi:hypothetical protein
LLLSETQYDNFGALLKTKNILMDVYFFMKLVLKDAVGGDANSSRGQQA